MKLRVAYNYMWPNNITSHILKRTRHEMKLLLMDLYKKDKDPKAAYLPWRMFKLRRDDVMHFVWYKNFTEEMDKLKPDVIVSNLWYSPTTWQCYWYARKKKIPFILQTEMKQYPKGLSRSITKILMFTFQRMFKYASYILPWTSRGVIFGKENFPCIPEKIILSPSGIDTQLFKKRKVKKVTKKLDILIVARMVPYKNYKDLLDACAILKKKGLKFTLHIRGDGPLEKDIKEQVSNLGLDDDVRFVPRTPYKKMPWLFSKMDLFVLPSYNEAIGLVVGEAMACGLPVVVSDTVGAATYVTPGKTGYVFETGNSKDLARKIMLLKNKKKREKMGRAAAKDINRRFDVKTTVKVLDHIIGKSV